MVIITTPPIQKEIYLEIVLENLSDYYVFYRSSDKNYPMFLTDTGSGSDKYYFHRPLGADRQRSYESPSPREAILKAMLNRTVHAVRKEDWTEIFKTDSL